MLIWEGGGEGEKLILGKIHCVTVHTANSTWDCNRGFQEVQIK